MKNFVRYHWVTQTLVFFLQVFFAFWLEVLRETKESSNPLGAFAKNLASISTRSGDEVIDIQDYHLLSSKFREGMKQVVRTIEELKKFEGDLFSIRNVSRGSGLAVHVCILVRFDILKKKENPAFVNLLAQLADEIKQIDGKIEGLSRQAGLYEIILPNGHTGTLKRKFCTRPTPFSSLVFFFVFHAVLLLTWASIDCLELAGLREILFIVVLTSWLGSLIRALTALWREKLWQTKTKE